MPGTFSGRRTEEVVMRSHKGEKKKELWQKDQETEETEKRAEENIDLIFSDFTKLLRLIQYEGDVLKNYSTKIKNEPRVKE